MTVRPLPFVGGLVLFLFGVFYGLNWIWTQDLFSGSVLIQILIPAQLFAFKPLKILGMVVALLGFAAFAFSFLRKEDLLTAGPFAARGTFYPFVFLLGLLLSVYGFIFLFAVSFAADLVGGGIIVFITVDYVGLLNRIIVVLLGLAILVFGVILLYRRSFDFSMEAVEARPKESFAARTRTTDYPDVPVRESPTPVRASRRGTSARSAKARKAGATKRKGPGGRAARS